MRPGIDLSEKRVLVVDDLTAFLVGAKSRVETLSLQREFDDYKGEPITAIIPSGTRSSVLRRRFESRYAALSSPDESLIFFLLRLLERLRARGPADSSSTSKSE